MNLNWNPFRIVNDERSIPKPRKIGTLAGLGDRMRSAAFAELQAVRAFQWAATHYEDASTELKNDWLAVVPEETSHYHSILTRMSELSISIDERPVSLRLWNSLEKCKSAEEFCIYICSAEERGRLAGIRLCNAIKSTDSRTYNIFKSIVLEELSHISIATKHFNWKPEPTTLSLI